MKESTLSISEFKAKCLRLLDEVSTKGNTLVITKHGRPIAKVLPVHSKVKPLMGSWKGLVKIKGDIVHFSEADDWESER